MILRHRQMLVLLSLGLLAGCASSKAPEPLRVFAAASTRESLEQVADAFRVQEGVPVTLNFGPSSTLARQIEQGAQADLFLSADTEWADYLGDKGLVQEGRVLLTNRLVVVVPADSSLALQRLGDLSQPSVRRLALTGPSVPAGRYAREALQKDGVWDRVRDRILEAGDVRAVLTFVARGEAEAGLVYATDAAVSSNVRVALEVKPEEHSPIRYTLVLVRRERLHPKARALFDFLDEEHAREVFRRAGFGIAGEMNHKGTKERQREKEE